MVDVEKCPYIEYKIQGLSGIIAKEEKIFCVKDDLIMLFENGSCGSLKGKTLYKSQLDKALVHKFIEIGRKNSYNMLLCLLANQ